MTKTLSVALVVAVFLVPATAQASQDRPIEIAAHDDPGECGGSSACLVDVNHSWSSVYAGDEIEITFSNQGQQAYSLAIVPGEEKSKDGDTSPEHAFLDIGDVEPGESITRNATVPEGTETAYLFVDERESEGMNLTRNVYPADAKGEEGRYSTMNDQDGNEDASSPEDTGPAPEDAQQNDAPLPLAGGLLALGVAANLNRPRSGD